MHASRFLCVLLAVAGTACAAAAAPDAPVEPVRFEKPLVAWWTFDGGAADRCADATGHGHDASLEQGGRLARTDGVFGSALALAGRHRLSVADGPDVSRLRAVTLAAWVRPERFERYNEIFRKEDGDRRVLFSFQEHGTVLSLGLNAGRYAECDARLDPKQVLDGRWHHCAATFDGQTMRVYLDGREIGSQTRAGPLKAGGTAPGCIGSLAGQECFQGAMDDLRLYAEALTAEEVARLHSGGRQALAQYREGLEDEVRAVYVPAETFAESLARSREALARSDGERKHAMARAVADRLQAAFPEAFADFTRWTEMTPVAYLTLPGGDANVRMVGRLIALLTEYMPLTHRQWAKQSPADRKKWKQVEAIADRFERLKGGGEAARFSPAWIEIALAAGPRIAFRPSTHEPVAPYVPPSTPETRDLTREEARRALERDWLHQADGRPTPERIRQAIARARQVAERIRADHPGEVDLAEDLTALDALADEAAGLMEADAGLYFRVREVKRRIMLANPVIDFDEVLLVDTPFPRGREWRHETRHRLGYMAVPGGRLLVLEGLSPGGHVRRLAPLPRLHGSFWRPDVSWDGRKVLFCFKPHNEKSFHLYEIGADGTGLVQLTDGPYDDLDPVCLPDGEHIAFTTTRGHTYVRCMPPTNAFVLARCDRDGRNIYILSRGNEPDYLPSVTADGRILYTRWEYTDKPLWRAQSLWTANPDGTQVATVWGNQSVWPDLLKDARQIPGSHRILFTGSAHHNWFAGSVGIIDPDVGYNFPEGLTKVTAEVPWPECGNGPVDPVESPRYRADGRYAAYYSPYPLSETDFLVSADRGGKFVLYLMDTDGNRELIYEGAHHILHAMPLAPRPRPPVIRDGVAWPGPEDRGDPAGGVLYSRNVYEGMPEAVRGKVRYLRVLTIEHKTYTYWYKRPYLTTGPVVSGLQSDGVKRVLGTVPVEADGSVHFRAPSGMPLHFQLLDADRRALQTMRSFTGVMPGERRGCLGCHELHSTTPVADAGAEALGRPPSAVTPLQWDDDSVSWARYVEPVLARYCGECHRGEGKGRKTLDLTPRPGHLGFDEAYWLFTGRPAWGRPYRPPANPPPGFGIAGMLMVEGYGRRDPAAYRTPEPMSALSYRSRLVEIASSGKHHGVKVDAESRRRLILWVDTMCPYRGSEEVRRLPDPEFQGMDWLAVRPRIRNAPRLSRPGPVD
ncbi:MAG: LamG-like jellyroll fold domain-containing protein [Phycisphaerae bacterium]